MTILGSAIPLRDAKSDVRGCIGTFIDITERKRAEEALRQSEERHRLLAETMLQGVVHQGADGKIIAMNPAAERILGKNREQFLGSTSVKEEHDTIRENGEVFPGMEHPAMVALRTGKEVRGVIMGVFNPRAGDYRWIDIDAVPVFYPGQTRPSEVYAVFEDITERRQAESALHNALQRFYHMLSSMYSGLLLMTDEGRVEFVNQAFCDYYGLKDAPADLVGMASPDFLEKIKYAYLHPDQAAARIREIIKRGQPVKAEEFAMQGGLTALRDFVPLNVNGKSYGRLWIHVDITERKHMEEELRKSRDELELRVQERTAKLRESEEKYRDLVESVNSIIIRVDAEGRVTFLNDYGQDFFGYSEEEIRGKHVFGMIVPPDTASGLNAKMFMEYIAKHPDRYRESEIQNMRRNGEKVWVSWTVTPLYEENGLINGLLAVGNDISERKRLETQLRQAQKMEALGTLTGGIAHDFNNILAAVIGFAELLEDHVPRQSREAHHLKRVLEAGLRGRDLVKQMLTFSRKTEQEKKPLRLSSIVKETVKFLRASTPSTINIRVEVRSESGVILGDPVQIQQVLMNLCTNAAFAMREKGGSLDIALSDFSVSPSSRDPQDIEPGLYMKLTVRDTGSGIAPEIIDKIFDPFFTTKEVGEGTGLGLSVVHGIVHQSGGSITVESEPGRGSTFTVYFPKTVEESVTASVSREALPTGSERILFVDDEEALVEMGEDILAELGYEVTSRMNGREALALFTADPSRFDLIITDQTMPDMTGAQLAKEILTIRADMPIIMCTGFSHLVDADKAKAAGIRAFAMKPLTKREIARTIRTVLEE
jgi:PAS domain S-box-containing protein